MISEDCIAIGRDAVHENGSKCDALDFFLFRLGRSWCDRTRDLTAWQTRPERVFFIHIRSLRIRFLYDNSCLLCWKIAKQKKCNLLITRLNCAQFDRRFPTCTRCQRIFFVRLAPEGVFSTFSWLAAALRGRRGFLQSRFSLKYSPLYFLSQFHLKYLAQLLAVWKWLARHRDNFAWYLHSATNWLKQKTNESTKWEKTSRNKPNQKKI